ncbi:MAG: cytochrome c biogenesis CcdA family protein [Candidatus Methanomethylicaceae archaeon]
MNITDLLLALMAGIFTSLSPCSFPLLPGYISYYIGVNPSLIKIIPSIILCALGLISIILVIGIGFSLIGSFLYYYIPFMPLIAGIAIIIMSFLMIFNINIKLPLKFLSINKRQGMFGIFIYGVIYGLVASSCSTPVFLSIIIYSFSLGLLYGITIFIIYSIGMSFPIVIATLFAYKAKTFILKKFSKSIYKIQRMSALILFLMGLYLILGLYL